MNITLTPSRARGKIKATASKSVAHRVLICAALADAPTRISCEQSNRDIEATVDCLCALGAKIEREPPYYTVTPIPKNIPSISPVLPCAESGSTLRFLLPVAAALGGGALFLTEGRLCERPLSPLKEELAAHGAKTEVDCEQRKISLFGRLEGRRFSIDGGVSSQFVSGLLFAISLMGGGELEITGKLESAPYVDMTVDALEKFGIKVRKAKNTYFIDAPDGFLSPGQVDVEGDWSNAAFAFALGALGEQVEIYGLCPESKQGDRAIADILLDMGASLSYDAERLCYSVSRSSLRATELDASNIPDLVPVIAVLASVAEGESRIYGVSRLRLKESDRIESISSLLGSLGAKIRVEDDALFIIGVDRLSGGSVSSFNDHRIAMSAAVAASACDMPLAIGGAESVNKSYPAFWELLDRLGIKKS